MQSAVLANSISEPVPAVHAEQQEQQEQQREGAHHRSTATPPPPYSALTVTSSSPTLPRKRKLPWQHEDEDHETTSNQPRPQNNHPRTTAGSTTDSEDEGDVFPWPLTADEERTLSQVTDQVEESAQAAPVTPRKMGKFDTGGLPANANLPTPDTTPHSLKINNNMKNYEPTTPTPLRFGHVPSDVSAATDSPSSTTSSNRDDSLVASVFNYFKEQNYSLERGVSEGLRGILDRHVMRDQGIIRGYVMFAFSN